MRVIPLTLSQANEIVTKWHRHNKKVVGHRFSIGLMVNDALVGVCIVGRPLARKIDWTTIAEITRLCVLPDAPKNSCSFLYGAARRIWKEMGGAKIITYTLQSETGASVRGAGFVEVSRFEASGKGWLSRDRDHQLVFDEPKVKWEANC